MPPRVELLFTGSDEGAEATALGVEEAVRQLGEGAEEANKKITTGLGAIVLEFKALDQSVRQQRADFDAGLLSVEQYEQGLEAARAEALALRQTTGTLSDRELRGFTGVLDKTAKTSSDATFKMGLFRNSVRGMAQQAAGVRGPVGGFISQLLQITGGAGLAVGAAASIGILALAFKALRAEAEKAEKAQKDAIDRLLKLRESARTDEAKQAEDVARAKEKLAGITNRITTAERELAAVRRQAGDEYIDVSSLEAEIAKLREDQLETLKAINAPEIARQARERTEHEKLYAEAVRESEQRLSVLAVRLAHVGLSHEELTEALRRHDLAQQGLTASEIAGLVVNDREAIARQQEIDQRTAILALMRETTVLMQQIAAPIGFTAPKTKVTPDGRTTVDTEELSGSEDFAHRLVESLDLSITMVEDLARSMDALAEGSLQALGSAFESVFGAIAEGGKVSGAAMIAGLLGAISKAALHEAGFYFARGVAALAGAVFPVPNPAAKVSAAQYFKASALMAAVGVGTGLAAGGVGGGGGGESGNLGPDRFRENGRRVQEAQGELRVILRGSAAVLAGDPDFIASVGEAFAQAAGTQQVIIELADGERADVQHIGGGRA